MQYKEATLRTVFKMGQIILVLALTIFLVVGGGMIMGIFPKDEPLAGPLFLMAMILAGAGANLVKKHKKE